MRFTKKTVFWTITSASVTFLAIFAVIYILNNRPAADTTDTDIFKNWPQQASDPNSTVTLPDQFYATDINPAARISQTQLSTKEKTINDYVGAKTLELLKKPVQNSKNSLKTPDDLIVRVVDKNGNLVSLNNSASTAQGIVSNNFDFDTSVSQQQKDILLLAYPEIEKIYGPRENSNPIHIVWDQSLDRGGWAAFNNTIYLDRTCPDWEPVHELVHAFRGDRTLNPFFEEGSAVVVTSEVCKKLGLTKDGTNLAYIQFGYDLDSVLNHPSIYQDASYTVGAGPYEYSYEVGGAMMSKLFIANSNFFKNFNSNLFKTDPTTMNCAPMGLPCTDQLIIKSISSVEGQPTATWITSQSYFTHMDMFPRNPSDVNNDYRDSYYATFFDSSIYRNVEDQDWAVTIKYNWLPKSTDFKITLRKQNGTILANNDAFVNVPSPPDIDGEIRKKFITYPPALRNYYGVIIMEATPNNDPENKRVSYLIQPSPNDHTALYIYDTQNPDKAIITNLGTGAQETLLKTNGYFADASRFIKARGRFRIDTYKQIRCKFPNQSICFSQVSEKFYNKTETLSDPGFMIVMPTNNNDCGGKINKVSQQGDSLNLQITSSNICAETVSINDIPVYRFWGKTYNFTSKPLQKLVRYKYSVFTASDVNIAKTISGYLQLK